MTETNSYTGSEKGRAFYGFAFVIYGMLLVGMLIGAAGMSLLAEPYVRLELNTLRRIIPLLYLPAVVLYAGSGIHHRAYRRVRVRSVV